MQQKPVGEDSGLDTAGLLRLAVAALGGDDRPGQVAMAEAVAGAIADGRHALVQAGTGTGKSLAYLVPAVASTVRDDARIVVSTATLALQRQVIQHDLPLILDALESALGARPQVALFKGRANYLCRFRLSGGYPEPDDGLDLGYSPVSRLGKELARLTTWARETDTGDRDDLEPGVSGLAWGRVSVDGRECLASACPLAGECFGEEASAKAKEAQIVVTNHAMLALQAYSHDVLGPMDALIVDEAHELVSRITSGATKELTANRIEAAARAARRCGAEATRLEESARACEGVLEDLRVGRLAIGLPESLAGVLGEVREGIREALRGVSASKEAAKPQDAHEAQDGAMAKVAEAHLLGVMEIIDAVIDSAERFVVWLAPRDGDYGSSVPERLLAAPLDVSGLIGSRLVDGRAAVFTSATLALGGTFDPMAAQLGIDDPVTMDAGSPFDYPSQGILYIASHLDRPGSGGIGADAIEELGTLIEAAGGRTLGLFSSHRAALEAVEAMRARLDYPVLYQRDDQVSTLLARFKEDPRACLFGSMTLWQGVDLPGETCQLVVIDRIPFPRPDDPIAQARSEAIEASGRNGFMAVSAAHAALLLAQGAGRLIRTLTDRGVVAVLDSRLATARYGGFLMRSLPGLWPTTDRVTVLDALRRLDGGDSEDAAEALMA
ncbi:MAG: ATP-dependent DNA helicase [Demequinaceae bacterium]|nr:ATP-dependent DNA helicase [Demequinaceae bacterium]